VVSFLIGIISFYASCQFEQMSIYVFIVSFLEHVPKTRRSHLKFQHNAPPSSALLQLWHRTSNIFPIKDIVCHITRLQIIYQTGKLSLCEIGLSIKLIDSWGTFVKLTATVFKRQVQVKQKKKELEILHQGISRSYLEKHTHRITELQDLERTSRDHWFQPPC